MNLSPLAQSLLEAGVALAHDNGPGFIAAFRAHDWKSVALEVVQAELTLAVAAGVPGAGVALKLLPVGLYLHAHPADPKSPAMAKAAGPGGGDTWSHKGNSPDIGAIP